MSDVRELITRCRKGRNAEPVLMLGGKAHDPRCLEAARALAAQAAEIERLTRERDEARMGQHAANKYEPTWAELVDVWRTRAVAAEAERAALRAALAFLRPSQWEEGDISGVTFDARWLAEHIDAALGQRP